MADALRRELVKGDRIAEAATARMRRGGEEAVVSRVAAIHIRMRDTTKDGEIIAVRLEHFQVRRELVAATGGSLSREEFFRQQAEVVAHAEEAAWRLLFSSGAGKRGLHGLQQRQRHADARGTQKLPA